MTPKHFLAALCLVPFFSAPASAQQTLTTPTTLHACYVPKSGTVYRIKTDGAPLKCAPNHVEFSWTIGAQQQSLNMVLTLPVGHQFLPGAIETIHAVCPAGTFVVAGSFASHSTDIRVLASAANSDLTSWRWGVVNESLVDTHTVFINVSCVKLQ